MLVTALTLILGALLGVPIAYYFSNRKSLSYLIDRRVVFDSSNTEYPEDVTISFRHEEIRKLSEWKLFIWNSGNQTVLGRDISSVDPITIVAENFRIISMKSFNNNKSVKDEILQADEGGKYFVSFEYLNSSDAIFVLIYGEEAEDSDVPETIMLSGSISDMPRGMKLVAKPSLTFVGRFKNVNRWFLYMQIPVAIFAVMSLTDALDVVHFLSDLNIDTKIMLDNIALYFIYVSGFALVLLNIFRSLMERQIPKFVLSRLN